MTVPTTPTFDSERALAAAGYDVIVGFDEVGRGSLAGPGMVGCAAFRAASLDAAAAAVPAHLNDSKLLTEHRREAMFDDLERWCDTYAIGAATNQEIDDWGISHALGIAALRALEQAERRMFSQMGIPSEAIEAGRGLPRVGAILDGPYDYITKALGTFESPDVPVTPHMTTQVKGDRACYSVACAAVLAKVTRDRLMEDLAKRPEYAPYQWESNKGYGSKAHREAIAKIGPSDLHRLTWKLT
ncbi:MAG: ribonuclease HII [Bifidobacterium sp.]|nr:ribonuclease HII [Bifidobacterium sp.]